MKIRLLSAAVLAAFVLSVSVNTYAQSDTKTVDKKVVTTEKKIPATEKKMDMKKGDKKVKVVKTDMPNGDKKVKVVKTEIKDNGTKVIKTDVKKNGSTVLKKEVKIDKKKGTKTTTIEKKDETNTDKK